MKVFAINGSPKGQQSISAVMLSALKSGMRDCEIVSVNLADKHIQHCRGCYACWTSSNGCILQDDFNEIIASAQGTDLIVFETPVYFENVSGLFKNFIDRLTSTGNPHAQVKIGAPKFVMLSNCGFVSEKEFEIISLWVHRFVQKMQSELLGEFYFPGGKRLRDAQDETAMQYLKFLQEQGTVIVKFLAEPGAKQFGTVSI